MGLVSSMAARASGACLRWRSSRRKGAHRSRETRVHSSFVGAVGEVVGGLCSGLVDSGNSCWVPSCSGYDVVKFAAVNGDRAGL